MNRIQGIADRVAVHSMSGFGGANNDDFMRVQAVARAIGYKADREWWSYWRMWNQKDYLEIQVHFIDGRAELYALPLDIYEQESLAGVKVVDGTDVNALIRAAKQVRAKALGNPLVEHLRIEEGLKSASSHKAAFSTDIVAAGISNAIKALQYIPTIAVSKNADKRVKAVVLELEDILGGLPVSVTYVAYIGRDKVETKDVAELVGFMKRHGMKMKGFSDTGGITRKWLWHQPMFDGMAGPVSDGPNIARYDTWEAFDALTR